MKQITVFAMIAALAAPLAVQAEDFYVGGNLGRAEQKADLQALSVKSSTTAYKFVGGYNINKTFGAEIGYVNLREVAVSGNGATAKSEPTAAYLAGTATQQLSQQFFMYGKVGVVASKEKITAILGDSTTLATQNRTNLYLSVGASYALNKQVSLVAEYENFGKIAKDGKNNVKADMFSAGVRYHF